MIEFDAHKVTPNGAFWFLNYVTSNTAESWCQPIYRMYLGDQLIFPKTDINKMYRLEITETIHEETDESDVNPYNRAYEYKSHWTNKFIIESPYPCFVKEVTDFSKWAAVSSGGNFIRANKALAIVLPCILSSSWKILAKAYDRSATYYWSDYRVTPSDYDNILENSDSPICPSELDTVFITEEKNLETDSLYRSYNRSEASWSEWISDKPKIYSSLCYASPALIQTSYSLNPMSPSSARREVTFIWRESPTSRLTNRFNKYETEIIKSAVSQNLFGATEYSIKGRETAHTMSQMDYSMTFSRLKDTSQTSSDIVTISGTNKFGHPVSFIEPYAETIPQYDHAIRLSTVPYGIVRVFCYLPSSLGTIIESNGVTYGPVTDDEHIFDIPFEDGKTNLNIRIKKANVNAYISSQVIYGFKYYYTYNSSQGYEQAVDCGDDRLMSRFNAFNSKYKGMKDAYGNLKYIAYNACLLWPTTNVNNNFHATYYIQKLKNESDDPNIQQLWHDFNDDFGYCIFDGYGETGEQADRKYVSYKLPLDDEKLEYVIGVWTPYGSSYSEFSYNNIPFYRFFNGSDGVIGRTYGSKCIRNRSYTINMCNTPIFESYDEWKRELLGG